MTVEIAPPSESALNRRTSENATTLMFRMGWKQKDLAAAAGINAVTLSRKLKNTHNWSLPEVESVAAATSVEVAELLGDLPEFDAWRARRDSNSQPSDLVSVQVSGCAHDAGMTFSGHCPACGAFIYEAPEGDVVDLAAYRQRERRVS